MSLSLIIVSVFEFKYKVLYSVLSSLCIFLNSKTSVVTNLKPFNLDNKSVIFLNVDSVFLSCSSELKEFKISALQELA